MKPKILILGYGGTIAMVPSEEGLRPARSVEEIVAAVPRVKEVADITLINRLNKDSTNLNPTHWADMAQTVAEHHDKFDGIILTHGTDTMAYSATAVSLALGRGLKIPVVFTGAQRPMVALGTDAANNLERSVETVLAAHKEGIAETMIFFDKVVLRASRSVKTSESAYDAFGSPALEPIGRATGEGIEFHSHARSVQQADPKLELKPQFDTSIFTLDVVPGINPDVVRHIIQSPNVKAVLMRSLGSGNVPSEGDFSLIPVIEEATQIGKPIIIATKFVGGKTLPVYETGTAPIKAGAIPAGDLTDVAAQVKLMWLLGQGVRPSEIKNHLTADFIGEVTNKRNGLRLPAEAPAAPLERLFDTRMSFPLDKGPAK